MTYANESQLQESIARARRGMVMPRPVELGVGQRIYRFYDVSRAPDPAQGADGAWWVEYEYFQKIRHFAAQFGYPLSYAARLFAAVLYEWSEVNAFVRCEVVQPLRALKGRGKQVEGTGRDPRDTRTMTPVQGHMEIYQLYLPGVGGRDSLAGSVLRVVDSHKL